MPPSDILPLSTLLSYPPPCLAGGFVLANFSIVDVNCCERYTFTLLSPSLPLEIVDNQLRCTGASPLSGNALQIRIQAREVSSGDTFNKTYSLSEGEFDMWFGSLPSNDHSILITHLCSQRLSLQPTCLSQRQPLHHRYHNTHCSAHCRLRISTQWIHLRIRLLVLQQHCRASTFLVTICVLALVALPEILSK